MRIAIFGEAMFEYRSPSEARRLAFGGDTLNTAIHLARLGWQVAYITAIGTDPLSEAMCQAWAAEGIDTRWVLRHTKRQPGIYAIHNDDRGERSFLYWRDQSAARAFFDLADSSSACAYIQQCDLLYFSLISLAILPEIARLQLLAVATSMRQRGGRVAFDSNFRAALWPSVADAQANSERAIKISDFGLPTDIDECALRAQTLSPHQLFRLWRDLGCAEVVVKTGELGCVIGDMLRCEDVPIPEALPVVDSSCAGDAFNAGYLHARLLGLDAIASGKAGHQLAGWVIGQSGAIPPLNAGAPYARLRALR